MSVLSTAAIYPCASTAGGGSAPGGRTATTEERERVLVDWNSTDAEYPSDRCIHQLFEAQVARTPDAVALIVGDERLTFRELDARANRLANYLSHRGVGPDSLVGICLERSPDMVIALLGILKAGGAYVPLDPSYPRERLAFMLEDSAVPLVLTRRDLANSLPGRGTAMVCIDADSEAIAEQDATSPSVAMTPDHLAYVIYTSGSTGRPKGVMGLHRGAINRFHWMWTVYPFQPGEVCCQKTTLNFVDSVWEMFGPLLQGVPTVLIPDEAVRDARRLVDVLSRHHVTRIVLVPSLLRVMLELPADLARDLADLRYVVSSGEALPADLARRFYERLPASTLINLYGSSEAAADSTCYEVPPRFSGRSVPIGRPIANTRVYVLDDELRPVPIGTVGQLYIGGAGLARGYLHRPDLTAERFVLDPFSERPGARMYRTGDLARWLPEGELEYVGRLDHQVKIRGMRVELGEIESVLREHPAVRQAVVTVHEQTPSDTRLVGYVVLDSSQDHDVLAAQDDASRGYISEWEEVWNQTYASAPADADPAFNIVGWNSSYDDTPLSADEMQEWVEQTVDRVLAYRPMRVLEIGCGTGLLLLRIAPTCSRYVATDVSEVALGALGSMLAARGLSQVKLLRSEADQFGQIQHETFDAVIINSVAQYFPSVDYLVRVLEGATRLLDPGGIIFVGDVRSRPLLKMLRASVELARAPASLDTDELAMRVQRRVSEEPELVLDPAFFDVACARISGLASARILLKRGRRNNELTKYRYDVVLHADAHGGAQNPLTLDWGRNSLTLERVAETLRGASAKHVWVRNIPNARLATDSAILELLASPHRPRTIADFRAALREMRPTRGVDPEAVWQLAEAVSYEVDLCWSGDGSEPSFDAYFRARGEPCQQVRARSARREEPDGALPWNAFANTPVRGAVAARIGPQLREWLATRLPEHMIPSTIILLDALPLTPNGKIDRLALPAPVGVAQPGLEVRPRDSLEAQLVAIWEEYLGVRPIGVTDDFFELGGNSLLAVRVFSAIEQRIGANLPLTVLFQGASIERLAQIIRERDGWVASRSLVPIQPEGSRPPFFCVHGVDGDVFWYASLARQLGPDQPFWGIQAPGLDGSTEPIEDLKSLAEQYVREVLGYQPGGPYYLGGFSIGATIAFEMACQLRERGEEVALLAIFDDAPPDSDFYEFRASIRIVPRIFQNVRFWLKDFARMSGHYRRAMLKVSVGLRLRRLKRALSSRLDGLRHSSRTSDATLMIWNAFELPKHHRAVLESLDRAYQRYQPGVFDGPITLFRARTQPTFCSHDPRMGWGTHTNHPVDVRIIPGKHEWIFVEPNVQEFGRELRTVLDAAMSRSESGKLE